MRLYLWRVYLLQYLIRCPRDKTELRRVKCGIRKLVNIRFLNFLVSNDRLNCGIWIVHQKLIDCFDLRGFLLFKLLRVFANRWNDATSLRENLLIYKHHKIFLTTWLYPHCFCGNILIACSLRKKLPIIWLSLYLLCHLLLTFLWK